MRYTQRCLTGILFFCTLIFSSGLSATVTDRTHVILPGYFNADNYLDILAIARNAQNTHRFYQGNGAGTYTLVDDTPTTGGLFGLAGISAAQSFTTGLFTNTDNYTDLVIQGATPGEGHGIASALFAGELSLIYERQWSNGAQGVNWDAQSHTIIPGNFYYHGVGDDNRTDVFIQARQPGASHALVTSNGGPLNHLLRNINDTELLYTSNGTQLSLTWNSTVSAIYAGDFNGDGYSDLFLQAKRGLILIPTGDGLIIPVQTNQNPQFAIVLNNGDGNFTVSDSWTNSNHLGLRWFAEDATPIIGDFDGDGSDDILLQSHSSSRSSAILRNNGTGQFPGVTQWLNNGAYGVNWSQANSSIKVIPQQDPDITNRQSLLIINHNGTLQQATTNGNGQVTNATSQTLTGTPSSPPQRHNHVQTSTAFGQLPGSFDVSPNGAASYTIPIAVPPGLGGMQPSLSLTYTSSGGNGMLGAGWNLSGLSAISRCGRTYAQDGIQGGINLDNADKLCLDGQRLVAVSGTYGRNGAQYRTESDSFSLVIQHNDLNASGSWFEVKTKAGQVFQYGATNDARFNIKTSAPISWAVNRITDAAGNYLTVGYSEDTDLGSQYPDLIEYTKNGSEYTGHAVKFVYEDQDTAQRGYIRGFATIAEKRLAAINTYQGTNLIQNYQIHYRSNEVTGQSLVDAVKQCAADGSCMPATNFEWQGTSKAAYTWNPTPLQTGICTGDGSNQIVQIIDHLGNVVYQGEAPNCEDWQREYIQYPDINGDGRSDICTLRKNDSAVFCALATENGMGPWARRAGLCVGDEGCQKSIRYADMNADGKADLIYRPSNSEDGIIIRFSNGVDFEGTYYPAQYTGPQIYRSGTTILTGIMPESVFQEGADDPGHNVDGRRFFTPELNGDGFPDICALMPDGLKCYLNTGFDDSKFISVSGYATTLCSQMSGVAYCDQENIHFQDLNQDGRQDLILRSASGIFYAYSTGTGFDSSVTTNICGNGSGNYGVCNDADNHTTIQFADVTGDGLADLCLRGDRGIHCLPGNGLGFDTQKVIATEICRNGSAQYGTCNDGDNYSTIRYVDINQDGKADIVYRSDAGMRAWLSTGTGFLPYTHSIWTSSILSNSNTSPDNWYTSNFADFNGDGLLDYAYRHDTGVHIYYNQGQVTNLLTGITDAFGNETSIHYQPLTNASVYTQFDPEVSTGRSYPEVSITGPMQVVQSYEASNGVGGMGQYSFHYTDLRAHVLGRGLLGFAQFSKYDAQSQVRTVVTNDRRYQGNITVSMTGKTFGRALYPTLGMPLSKQIWHEGGAQNRLLEQTTYTNNHFTTAGSAYFPYFEASTQTTFDFDTGNEVTRVVTNNYYEGSANQQAGNITRIEVTTTDVARNESFLKETVNQYSDNLANWILGRVSQTTVTHTGHGDTQVRKSAFHYYTSTAAVSDPDGSFWQFAGMLHYTEEEPDALAAATDEAKSGYLKTTYLYDRFGQKSKVKVTGYTGFPFTLEDRYSLSFYEGAINSRYLTLKTRNQLGHTETKTIDSYFGVATRHEGPNGIPTTWDYDNFGRVEREVRADGTNTISTRGACGGQCTAVAGIAPAYWTTSHASGTAPATMYYDRLGRELRSETSDLNGNVIHKDTVYDANGRVEKASKNYFIGDTPLWTYFYYDAIGRVDREEDLSGTVTQNSYSGLSTTTTVTRRSNLSGADAGLAGEPQYQDRITVKHSFADGNVRKVIDPAGGEIHYAYDAVGNLVRTRAPNVNPGDHSANGDYVETVMEYDQKGRKTDMLDPDMGTWHYTYDSFGKLIKQVDAKNQTVVMLYDNLDRLVLQIEPEGLNKWVYDSADGAGIGKLHMLAGPIQLSPEQYNTYINAPPDPASITLDGSEAVRRTFTYDPLGRPLTVLTNINNGANPAQTFQVDRNYYPNTSRVREVIYPQNVSGTRLTLEHRYDETTGTLLDVRDVATSTVYWKLGDASGTLHALDEFGHIQKETYANGLSTDRYYDRATGLLQSVGTNNMSVQDSAYVFDSLGNLQKREDGTRFVNNNPINEVFRYDTLNRLRFAWLNGTQSQEFRYNAAGNITYNSRFNWYYHYDRSTGGGHHAVAYTSSDAAGVNRVNTYDYDANGNLYSGDNRGISYTSYNKPWQIVRSVGGQTSIYSFYYGADHSRYKQEAPDKTIYYLRPSANAGAHFEREVRNGRYTDIHYIYAGGGLVATHNVRQNADATITAFDQYYHRDHLGSIEVITDGSGAVIERLSYAAFGERRDPSGWSLPDAQTLIAAASTNYGFTGHEHIDDVGLIHMNGRVYDPKLGRFLSADPNVQAPHNSQSYNRYSYVLNNPLSLTDPSGYFFSGLRSVLRKAMPYIKMAVIAYVSYQIGVAAGNWAMGSTAYLSNGAIMYSMSATTAAVITGAVGGATMAALTGGNIVKGALTGAAFGAIGASGLDGMEAMMAHGMVGGMSSELQGGKFGSGFMAAFAGKGITIHTRNFMNDKVGGFIKASIAGGIVAELGGGKFSNGAYTAAMGYLFNELSKRIRISIGYTKTTVGDPWSRHALVIATDVETGSQFATRAGPGFGKGDMTFGDKLLISAEADWFNESFRDRPSQVLSSQHVGYLDISIVEFGIRAIDFATLTNENRMSYFGIADNSNSYAFTFVESLGFERPEPMVFAPGWRNGHPDSRLTY